MKKSDLVEAVTTRASLSARAADDVVDNIFEQITNALARDESVNLMGFGSFSVRQKPQRQGRHPGTGETITIEAHKVPVYKPAAALKKALQGDD